MKIAIGGAAGRTGRHIVEAVLADPRAELSAVVEREDHPLLGHDASVLVGRTDPTGVILTAELTAALAGVEAFVDFSVPSGTDRRAAAVADAGSALVVGTTGLGSVENEALQRAAERVPVVAAPNMSVGVNVVLELLREAASKLGADYHFEIFEMHHDAKVDAPSGTALRMGEVVAGVRGLDLDEVVRYGRSGSPGPRGSEEIGIHAARGGDVVGDHLAIFAGPGERVEISHRAGGRETFARGALRAALWTMGRAPGLYGMSDVLDGSGVGK